MEYPLEIHLPDGSIHLLEVPMVSFGMLDILKMELERVAENVDYFEYEDEDCDRIAVRNEEDLSVFFEHLHNEQSARIWIVAPSQSDLNGLPMLMLEDIKHLEVISNGQFGTVYRSLHIPEDRVVAVKCIELRDESESRDDLLRELQILGKCCRSEFVVQLIGATVDGNTLSIILEYLDGGSLTSFCPLPVDILKYVSRSILEGISYLSSVNVMHRDLKPDNVCVDSNGYVKLADFGVSKVMENSVADSYVGTNVYMAPERIYGGSYKMESEIWSLGVTLLQMATGRFPFCVEGEGEIPPHMLLNRILREECPIDDEVIVRHGRKFEETVRKCVRRDAATRWSLLTLSQSPYMQMGWPIDRLVIGDFVKSRR